MTTAHTDESKPVAWYKQFWPWFLIALPTAAVIGCVISIDIAFKHADKVIEGDYQQHGLTVLHKSAAAAAGAARHAKP